jgi:hypothetical protein
MSTLKGEDEFSPGLQEFFADVKEEMSGKAECRLWFALDAVEKEDI